MKITLRESTAVLMAAMVTLAACDSDGPTHPPPAATAVALAIAPSALLFAAAGEKQQLKAYAVDADGKRTEVSATFTTSNPSIAAVTPAGLATGGTTIGSAQIVATSAGLTSAPVLALRATPAAGALLVDDSQVIGAIEPMNPAAPYQTGWQYRVRLRGATPSPGQVVLATGGAPVGGRVVSVAGAGSDVDIVLELIPVAEMFDQITMTERLPLEHATLAVSTSLRNGFRLEPKQAGGIRLEARQNARYEASAAQPPLNSTQVEQEFDLGPFECKAEVPPGFVFPLTVDVFSFELDPNLTFDVAFNNGTFQRAVVTGTIAPRITASPRITGALEAKAECKIQLATLHLPIGGPLSLILGGQVPLGVGFEIGAKATFGQIGFDAFVQAAVTAQFGIDCAAGCEVVSSITSNAPGSYFKPVLPDLGTDVRFELGVSGFGWAELAIGNGFLQALQFKAIELKAGLEQKLELGSRNAQAADAAYASSFSLKPVLEAKAAANLQAIANLLSINLATLTFAPELPTLARSPHGTFTITPASVTPGDGTQLGEMATFTVNLTDVTYLGAYAVEGIEIRWQKTNGTTITFEPGRPGCTDLAAAQDQVSFTCQTDFLEEHEGTQTFYAFVKTRIFGVPIPVPLEIVNDAKATVTVASGSGVVITPATVTLAPGDTQQFTATVSGSGSQEVTWAATGGTFTTSGNTIIYTAGATPGTYSVVAASAADPGVTATAEVTISDVGGDAVTLTGVRTVAMARTYEAPFCEQRDDFEPTAPVLSRQSPVMSCTSGSPSSTATAQNAFTVSGASDGAMTMDLFGRGTLSGAHVGDHHTQVNIAFTVVGDPAQFNITGSISGSISAQTRFGTPKVVQIVVAIVASGGTLPSSLTNVRIQNGQPDQTVQVARSGELPPGDYTLVASIQGVEANSLGEFDVRLELSP
jgi:hypothetical protein